MKKIILLLSILVIAGFVFEPSVSALECKDLNIKVENNLISIHVKEQPLSCVLEQVALLTNVSIKAWRDIDEPVTLDLNRVSLTRFFQEIGDGNALVYEFFPEKNQYRLIRAEVVKSSLSKLSNGRNAGAGITTLPSPDNKIANTPAGQSSSHIGLNNKKREGSDIPANREQRPMVKPGELLVRFKEHVKQEQREELHAFLGSTVVRKIDSLNLERLKLDPELTLESAAKMYLASDLVRSAEPHALRTPYGSTPNDPMFSEQWGLTVVSAPAAWTLTRGGDDVVVAVIDSGVDYNHEDLKENIWINKAEAEGTPGVDDDNNGYVDDIFGWDFGDQDSTPLDLMAHGTHVAGIIGAVTDNGIGISGVCPKIKIMVLKVSMDGVEEFENFNVLEAVEYAKNQGADIINCSFGGDESQTEEFSTYKSFLDENKGLMICAAGNYSSDNDLTPTYPACYDLPGIISVAASSEISPGNYGMADFSNYGSESVDVMAPGENILSTVPKTLVTENDTYFTIGTLPEKYPAHELSSSGTTDEQGLKAKLVDCGYGHPDEIDSSVENSIALIQRRGPYPEAYDFSQKMANVQDRGAVGAIIYNSEPGDFQGGLGSSGNWIPAITVSKEIGLSLQSQIPTNVTLFNLVVSVEEVFYQAVDGTSMSAPFVTGLAALLRSKLPEADSLKLKQLILDGVDPIDSLDGKVLTKGQVNCFKTLAQLGLPGDINKDYWVDLEDAILGLKILSGNPSDGVNADVLHWDVDKDNKLGSPDIIRALQQ